jgi:hypothetical protein
VWSEKLFAPHSLLFTPHVSRLTVPLLFLTDSLTNRLMKIIRLYTGTDNESHFEELDVELNFIGHMEVSALQPAHGIVFRRAPATHLSDYHNAPRRQYVITLAGQVEIETGDGTVRRFGPGDVMLADDTTGHGHITRVVGGQPRHYVMIPLK